MYRFCSYWWWISKYFTCLVTSFSSFFQDTVDWNQGLVLQVHRYGYDYLKWVHSPVDKQLKLFSTQFLEFFSKTPWYFVPILWLPVIIAIAFHSFSNLDGSWTSFEDSLYLKILSLCALLVCGFCTWTLLEYILHRFLFHLNPPGDSKFWITLHFFLHGQHHKVNRFCLSISQSCPIFVHLLDAKFECNGLNQNILNGPIISWPVLTYMTLSDLS